jgi:deoxyribose-phosphate aldolase
MEIIRPDLASYLDFTLLKPEATEGDITALCTSAIELGTFAVCVSPSMVVTANGLLEESDVKLASVVGFPSGAHFSSLKGLEATFASRQGAHEIDMVVNLRHIAEKDWESLGRDISAVRLVTGGHTLKVILETALWDDERIVTACKVARDRGADFVKTSTGYHSVGGASVHAVELMAATVGDQLGVKASGGIRSAADVDMYIAAGATRIGTSSASAILCGSAAGAGY